MKFLISLLFPVLTFAASPAKQVSSLKTLNYDKIQWNASTGTSAPLDIDVPADAISFAIYVYSAQGKDNEFYLVESVTDPKGKAFVSPKAPAGQKEGFGVGPYYSPNKSEVGVSSGYSGLMVPNNPKLKMIPGKWKFSVRAADSEVKPTKNPPLVAVVIKSKSGGPISAKTKGKLNLTLQFTGSDGWTAETAGKNAELQATLKKLAGIYANIGIAINVEKSINTKFPDKIADVNAQGTFDLYKSGASTDGVNIMFVSNIILDAQNTAQGLSGALPGPFGIPNVAQNGVLVITKKISELERKAPTANVMAHEIGHYLGLPHTYDGADVQDPFSDTPKAGVATENLMQPGLDQDFSEISEQQRTQIFLNPAVTLFE